MLRLPPTKKALDAIVAILEDDSHDTAEGMARALWDAVTEQVQERGKWTVVGQLRDGKNATPETMRESRICLGLFATEGDAHRAVESMAFSTQTNEEFTGWVLPVMHGTPAQMYAERRKRMDAVREKPSAWERLDDGRWRRKAS